MVELCLQVGVVVVEGVVVHYLRAPEAEGRSGSTRILLINS